jgi:uncharacterized coiled-coil DUF342 family protein
MKIFALFVFLLLITQVTWAEEGDTQTNNDIDDDGKVEGRRYEDRPLLRPGQIMRNGTNETPPFGRGPEEREHRNKGTKNGLRLNDTNATDFKERREEIKGQIKEAKIEFKEQREELRDRIKETRREFKENRKEFMAEIKERVKENHDRIQELRKTYQEKRESFKEAREALKDCKNTTACKEAAEELHTEAKIFTGNGAEQMINIINVLKTRIEGSSLDDEMSADVTAQLNVHAENIADAQAAINTSSDVNATKEAIAELRAAWENARVTIRLSERLLAMSKFDRFLEHMDKLEGRFVNISTQLKAEGKNTTALDAAIASFKAKVDVAESSYNTSLSTYVETMATADTMDDAKALVKTSEDDMKKIREELKEARTDLRTIMQEIGKLKAEALADVAAEVSAEVTE